MYKVVVLYEQEPDALEYQAHAEMCRCVPNSVFRHGKVTGSPMGEASHAYFAEWEFADKDAFDAAVRSEEFMATGKDAYKRGLPQPTVEFLELS
jgi:hypothetical protein